MLIWEELSRGKEEMSGVCLGENFSRGEYFPWGNVSKECPGELCEGDVHLSSRVCWGYFPHWKFNIHRGTSGELSGVGIQIPMQDDRYVYVVAVIWAIEFNTQMRTGTACDWLYYKLSQLS